MDNEQAIFDEVRRTLRNPRRSLTHLRELLPEHCSVDKLHRGNGHLKLTTKRERDGVVSGVSMRVQSCFALVVHRHSGKDRVITDRFGDRS